MSVRNKAFKVTVISIPADNIFHTATTTSATVTDILSSRALKKTGAATLHIRLSLFR